MSDTSPWSRRRVVRDACLAAAGATLASLPGCSRGASLPKPASPPSIDVKGGESLKFHAANARLLFGFALDTGKLRNDALYRGIVEDQCSIIVAENAMKWRALRPAPDRYFFDDADMLVEFAASRKMKLRGHNLCWHEALPDWFATVATRENARNLLRDHIRTVAGRYAGSIHSWDVVNEAVDVKDGRPDGLRDSPWLQLVGPDYVETAFRAARESDPTALLTYNDYGIEEESRDADAKRAAVLMMLRRMKQRNVPLDAVGIQSHLSCAPSVKYGPGLQRFIENCREMSLEVFLTEMDANDRALPSNVQARDAAVAQRYAGYLDLTLRSLNVSAVLTWGVTDAGTWLNHGKDREREDGQPQRPLLFDAVGRLKAAFTAVRDVFDRRFQPAGAAAGPVGAEKPLPKL